MRIGIVLSAVPAYSETFFNQKIAGLKASGYDVILFTNRGKAHFNLCPVIFAPPVFKSAWRTSLSAIFHLTVLALTHPGRLFKFFQTERISGNNTFETFKKLYLNSHILKQKLDWLHFGFATLALGREHVANVIGAKMAVSIRGYDLNVYSLKHPGCFRLLWEKVDKVHYISDDLYHNALKNGLSTQKAGQKITPALNIHLFKRSKPAAPIKTPIRFLTVARLHWTKGLSHTLEALAILKNEGLDFRYQIIGTGPEYEYLLYTTHQLGLEQQVTFSGQMQPDEVRRALESADIYLQYSISEGFCNAVLEAQAMELLCIASDAGGLQENIQHKVTGWLVPARQPETLAARIIKVVKLSPEKQQQIRQAARNRVLTTFNQENQNSLFEAFYQR